MGGPRCSRPTSHRAGKRVRVPAAQQHCQLIGSNCATSPPSLLAGAAPSIVSVGRIARGERNSIIELLHQSRRTTAPIAAPTVMPVSSCATIQDAEPNFSLAGRSANPVSLIAHSQRTHSLWGPKRAIGYTSFCLAPYGGYGADCAEGVKFNQIVRVLEYYFAPSFATVPSRPRRSGCQSSAACPPGDDECRVASRGCRPIVCSRGETAALPVAHNSILAIPMFPSKRKGRESGGRKTFAHHLSERAHHFAGKFRVTCS